MRDSFFEGRDVADAVAAAARALGLPVSELRYVVLEPGAGPTLPGLASRPARIAVLLDRPGAAPGRAPAPAAEARRDPRAGLLEVLGAVCRAAGVEVGVGVEESPEAVVVRLSGAGCAFFLEDEARVASALEHLLQRMFGRALAPQRLRLECEGYGERRAAALRDLARRLAADVRADGRSRATPPLNSYERRLVHLAVGAEPGLVSYSVGEGAERKVTVALAPGPDPAGSD